MKRIAAILALVLAAGAARAVDTWEPYPMGPGAVEFYLVRSGLGLEGSEERASTLVLGPAWGLHESTHVYLFTAVRHADRGDGGPDLLSLGIFRNFLGGFDGSFKADGYFELAAFGPGLSESAALAGLELNVDRRRLGLFARPALSWFHGEEGDGESAWQTTLGLWGRPIPGVQLLADARWAEDGDGAELRSLAGGANIQLSREVELILELRGHEPPADGERSFDLTVGAVTVW